MAESLPARRALYKKTTDPDNAWVEAVGGEFQAESGIEYEVCCVGPSDIAKKTWISSGPVALVPPAEFGYSPPFSVYSDGSTDIDMEDYKVSADVTYYLSPDGNDGNDGLTIDTPKKSAGYLVQALSETPPAVGATLILAPGEYAGTASTYARMANFDLNMICEDGVAIFHAPQAVTWSKSSGLTNVYQATIATTSSAFSIIDRANVDSVGRGIRLHHTTSTALCDSTPGSAYLSGTTAYIHTHDSRVPDGDIVVYAVAQPGLTLGALSSCYIENVHFHGFSSSLRGTLGHSSVTRAFNGCKFLYSAGENGLYIDGANDSDYIYYDCDASYSFFDGISHKGSGSRFVEINCVAQYNGYSLTSTTDNGTTAHDDCVVLRANCTYTHNNDRNLHDVNSSRSWNVACSAGYAESGSLDAYESGNFVFGTQGSADSTYAWMYECTSLGGSASDVCSYGAAIVTLSNCVGVNVTDTDGTAEIIVL